MAQPKNWKDWEQFAATASEKKVRAMILTLVLRNAKQKGANNALRFIYNTQHKHISRMGRRLIAVCKENEMLGGKQGKKVLSHYKK